VLADLLDLVLPDRCPGCASPAHAPACAACLALLDAPARPAAPDPLPPGLPVPWAVASYDGAVRALVVAHKEAGRLGLARWFGLALARSALAVAGAGPVPLRLIPVPSTKAARRARGHDPTLRTARYAAAALRFAGVEAVVLPVLTHVRRVADQAGLDAAERAANLRDAFCVHPRRRQVLAAGPARLIVVDDIVTTGATLLEAVRALGADNHCVHGTAVVAATPRRLTR
jgi:predicted amidophosphoribosyltransferase